MKQKQRKRFNRLKDSRAWWFLLGIWLGLTPTVFTYADMSRGYNAIGGEIFYPFIPLVIWLIVETVNDMRYDLDQLPKG